MDQSSMQRSDRLRNLSGPSLKHGILGKRMGSSASLKRHTLSKSQSFLDAFKNEFPSETITSFIKSLSPNRLKIITLLDDSLYPAAIARRLKLSRSYVSRFVKELQFKGLISIDFVNPITRRATSYRLTKELKDHLARIQSSKPDINFSLCVPHKLRYKYKMLDKKKPISLNTKRFAASKIIHRRTYCMVGGVRNHFEYKHPLVGWIGLTIHPQSLEVYQKNRKLPIRSASIEDATSQIAMALHETANRFMQEQLWENVAFTLGDPVLVTSPEYAFQSRLARTLTDTNHTYQQFAGGIHVDKSLEAKYGDKETAELETTDVDAATIIDGGLKMAYTLEKNLPNMIKSELKSVADEILGITEQRKKIDIMANNVVALCQSGLPLANQFSQLTGIVSQQGFQITKIQETMLELVKNMGKIIDKMGGSVP